LLPPPLDGVARPGARGRFSRLMFTGAEAVIFRPDFLFIGLSVGESMQNITDEYS